MDDYFDNYPSTLKKFNREAFENMIECIIVEDYDEIYSSNDKDNSDKNNKVSLCIRNVLQ